MKPKVIVIVGPTASGKTAVSIELAKKINGEIVSADSMQVYKYMNIGTAKPSVEEQAGIPHHLIDVVEPYENFNVARYQEMATQAIEEVLKKGKTPIVVGGTGLYINTLVNGVEFAEYNHDEEYVKELNEIALKNGIDVLYEELKKVDPESAQIIDKQNVRRVIRALEIFHVTGKTKTELDSESVHEVKYNYLMFGMEWEREVLYNRINKRVDLMMEQGLVEEVKSIIEKYQLSKTALQGLGYKEVIEYLEDKCSYDEMVEKIKLETRHYAKRQLTWFKRDGRITWLAPDEAVNKILLSFQK